MKSATAATLFRRRDFVGVTDKYARRHHIFSPADFTLEAAISGQFPFDPTGGQIDFENMRDDIIYRLERYEEGHNFYKGEHFDNPFEDGERKTVFNYCKSVIDKAVDWTIAEGWKVICPEGNEQVALLLNAIWGYNNRNRISQRAIQFSTITGDSFYYVTVRATDKWGNKMPRKKWTVRIQVLNPRHVFPVWSETISGREMVACLIQFPTSTDLPNNSGGALSSLYITKDKIYQYINSELIDEYDNPVGEINVVHVPNFELADSMYGQSDLEPVIPVNIEYNTVAHSIRRIIKYHAEPTTIIYGAKASNLEKGANKVWSNLPGEGKSKVENLALNTDLAANFQYLERLERLISELSSTPRVAFDSFDVRVTASSAAAFQLMFQPLVEKTKRRQIPHSEGMREINRLALLFQERVIGDPVSMLADDVENLYESDVEYTSPLPRDEAVELDIAIKRVNAGVWSQAEMIRRVSHVKHHERLILELLADRRRLLAETYEKQRALMGERPSSLSAFLGSETLSEEFLDIQQQIAVLEGILKAEQGEDPAKPKKLPRKRTRRP